MQADYWDQLSSTFEKDVFNPLTSDLHSRISRAVHKVADGKKHIADMGCGTGSLLPLLSGLFASVTALDLSVGCLQVAEKRHRGLDNVSYKQTDLAQSRLKMSEFDVVVCLNVAIMPSYTARQYLFSNLRGSIKPGGTLILLVPSVESVLYTVHQLIRWNLEDSVNYREAAAAASAELGFTANSIRDGVVDKGGTATKHYLKEELELLIQQMGLHLFSIEKVEYAWSTEFSSPPASMGAPYPWDWLLLARRNV